MMIDDLMNNYDFKKQGLDYDQMSSDLKQAFVIKAQNVSDYFYGTNQQEIWSVEHDFPNITPPFDAMWFEWKLPKESNSNGIMLSMPLGGMKIGALLHSTDLTKIEAAKNDLLRIDEPLRWVCSGWIFFQSENGQPLWIGCMSWYVERSGKFRIVEEFIPTIVNPFHDFGVPKEQIAEAVKVILYVPFMTLCFMHCKNVKVEKSEAWPEKLQRSRIKKGKTPLVKWHTLTIDPMKKVVADENNGNQSLTPKALHICRGHFKHFVDKGLFGKYHGTYWWPMHTRGAAENGVVNKDYAVKAGVLSEVANGVG